ncbi:MAG: lysylphosphatidylglycerol synthase transmembrane domain-containing protein [Acidimicrobiales bacterium]
MSRVRTVSKRILWLSITAISLYLVVPSVIQTFSSWPELQRLREGSLILMAGATLLSLVCFWILLGLCLRSRAWSLMATSQLSSAAVARILPGGSATATATQYRLLADGGIEKTTAASGLTVATLLNFAVLFALPVFSVPAILFGPPVDSALVNGAVAAAISFVAAAILGGLFLWWDHPLAALGRGIDRIAGWFGRLDPDAEPRSRRLLKARDLIRSHLADNWYWAALASFGKWGFDYLALVLAVRGVGHDDTSSVLLLAFVSASLLGRIPLTPGGLGFVEAGLAGTLALAGLSAADAATATLAYRLVSYWIPIPLGALAYGIHRRRMSRRGVDVPPLADQIDAAPT